MGTMMKMVCESAKDGNVTLRAVYSADPNHPNYSWWKATPAGSLDLQILNPEASAMFTVGEEYMIHVMKAKVMQQEADPGDKAAP